MYKIKDNIIAISPGMTIKEELEFLGMTQSEFSERMGFSEKHISKLINGEAIITAETARKLEMVLGISSTFWSNLEAEYRECLFKIEELEKLSEEVSYVDFFPVKEILKKGWIKLGKKHSPQELIIAFRKFFGVANMQSLNNVEKLIFEVKYRKNEKNFFCTYSMLAWMRKGEVEFKNLELEEYSEIKLKESLPKLKELSEINTNDSLEKVKKILSECGVGFLIVEHLPKTYVSGMTKWIGNKVMIILSNKGKSIDIFWFNLFHELGHVLKHGKKKIYINDQDIVSNLEQEKEADDFAKNNLIPAKEYKEIVKNIESGNNNEEFIVNKAKELKIHPSIIIGRLQHDKIINYTSKLSKLKENMIGI